MSELKFNCPKCDQHLACDESFAGRQIACPSCQNAITVPELVPPPSLALKISPPPRPAPAANPPLVPMTSAAARSFPGRKLVKPVFLSLHKHEYTYTDGPQVVFDCPACQARGVAANTRGTRERFMSFGLIPLFRVHYTDVACTRCGRSFRLHRTLDTVLTLTPEDIARGIRRGQIPFFIKFSIVTGVVLGVLPIVGLVFASIGAAFSAKRPSPWRTAAFVGLVLSLMSTALMVAMLISSSRGSSHTWPSSRRDFPSRRPGTSPSQPGIPPARDFNHASYAVGEKVEASWGGRWRPATVTELHGTFVRLRFEDSETPPELSLPANNVRPRR